VGSTFSFTARSRSARRRQSALLADPAAERPSRAHRRRQPTASASSQHLSRPAPPPSWRRRRGGWRRSARPAPPARRFSSSSRITSCRGWTAPRGARMAATTSWASPIVMLSSTGQTAKRVGARRRLGRTLIKPVTEAELLQALVTALATGRRRRHQAGCPTGADRRLRVWSRRIPDQPARGHSTPRAPRPRGGRRRRRSGRARGPRAQAFDVVLMDCRCLSWDGLDTTRATAPVKARSGRPALGPARQHVCRAAESRIPIVPSPACAEERRGACLDAGMD